MDKCFFRTLALIKFLLKTWLKNLLVYELHVTVVVRSRWHGRDVVLERRVLE